MLRVSSLFVVAVYLLWQYLLGECDSNNVIGDKRMAELSLLGEVRPDLTLEESISYNGKFPLWKRIMVALRSIQVSLFMYSYFWIIFSTQ